MKPLLAFCACVLIAPVVLGASTDADDPCRRFNTMNACGDAANEKCQWCGN
jgi:hypothetical protein